MDLAELLNHAVQHGASDLHLTASRPPMVRISGQLLPSGIDTELGPDDTKALIYSILTDDQKAKFEEEHELDFSIGIPGLSRFRVNVFMQRGCVSGVFRTIGENIPSCGRPRLERHHSATRLASARPGAGDGPTGSGKSTTPRCHAQPGQPEQRRAYHHHRGPD